jgi:hypothetical protein
MNITTDSHYMQGFSHETCQDYALHDKDVAIISDGCSSQKNTDIGARILAYTAKKLYKRNKYNENLVIYNASCITDLLGINNECLYATLSIIKTDERTDGLYICVDVFGDGIVVFKDKNGMNYHSISYTHNAPEYLAYRLDPKNKLEYRKISTSEFKIIEHSNNETVKESLDYNLTYVEGFASTYIDVEYVAVLSDGLFSFVDQNNSSCPYSTKELVHKLFDLKIVNENFMKRRLKKFIKDMEKEGYRNYDDISVAIMHFGE